jgi:uncharacterized ferredoxin-like protein
MPIFESNEKLQNCNEIKCIIMSIIFEAEIRKQAILNVAHQMVIAARTAPKGKGMDYLQCKIVDGETIDLIASRMREIGARPNTAKAFTRDAENIQKADAMVLLGTQIGSLGLAYCSLCGYENCAEKEKYPNHPCAFNTGDLGIAIGSAASVAMDNRVDNRIMYTVGMAVKELGLMGPDVKIIYGIPLSASSKNVFFDRK